MRRTWRLVALSILIPGIIAWFYEASDSGRGEDLSERDPWNYGVSNARRAKQTRFFAGSVHNHLCCRFHAGHHRGGKTEKTAGEIPAKSN
jgi:hypothetical protein